MYMYLGHNTLLKHRIDTADSQPFKSHPHNKSAMECEHIAKEVQKLLEDVAQIQIHHGTPI